MPSTARCLVVPLLALSSALAFSPSPSFVPRLAGSARDVGGTRGRILNVRSGRPGLREGSPRMAVDTQIAQLAYGMVAGSVSSVMMLPADLVKTAAQMKTQTTTLDINDGKGPQTVGMCVRSFLTTTVQRDGPLGLFKGFKPAIVGGAPEAGIQFMLHDFTVGLLSATWLAMATSGAGVEFPAELFETVAVSLSPGEIDLASSMIADAVNNGADTTQLLASAGLPALPAPPAMLISSLAGCAAGFGQVLVTCPMDVMKQREILGKERLSMLQLGPGLFKGAGATWFRDIPFSALYFSFVSQFGAMCHAQGLGSAETTVVAGLAAGVLASMLTTPADVIKTRVQCEDGKETIGSMSRKILREDGPGGFFTGVGARVSKIGPLMMINICVYESLKAVCSSLL